MSWWPALIYLSPLLVCTGLLMLAALGCGPLATRLDDED